VRERGGTLGFAPGAMVWHHRRNTVRRFWRQQFHYGAAEGDLRRKWPQRHTPGGRIAWAGRLYGGGVANDGSGRRRRIFHGTWGSAAFQSVYDAGAGTGVATALLPAWHLMIAALAVASLVGLAWGPMGWAIPVFGVAVVVCVVQAAVAAGRATFPESRARPGRLAAARGLTILLHLVQPLARLVGRGSTWARGTRGRRLPRVAWPWPRAFAVWHETWASGERRLEDLERRLRDRGVVVSRGGDYDRWDLEAGGGAVGGVRLRMTLEEHGAGKQMARVRAWPRWAASGAGVAGAFVTGGILAAAGWRAGAVAAACALAAIGVSVAAWWLVECGAAMAAVRDALADEGARA
jgi:hypothetical protein